MSTKLEVFTSNGDVQMSWPFPEMWMAEDDEGAVAGPFQTREEAEDWVGRHDEPGRDWYARQVEL